MLVAVLMTALLLLPAVLTAVAIGEANNANQAVAHDSALAAAEAGIADYTNALNYNSGSSGYQTLNASNSTYAAFGGSGGTPTWEPVNGAPNECYFYETTAVSGSSDSITVTGRYGPSAIANGVCKSKAGIHYEYKTLAVTVQPVESNPYLYSNQYQAPNPFVYGAFSGGPNACGYYAYGQNNSWGYMEIGLEGSIGFSVGGNFYGWTFSLYGHAQTLSGAYGPTEAGPVFSSNGGWNWQGFPVGLGFNEPGGSFWGYSPFTDVNNATQGDWNNWNFAYSAYNSGQDGPNGCGLFGSPYHDGYWSQADSFNGNTGAIGGSANAQIYTNDEYYVCNTYSGNQGATFSNVALESGDPYTTATAPSVPWAQLNPGIYLHDNYNLAVIQIDITWFQLTSQNAWTAGPAIPSSTFPGGGPYTLSPYYIPADSGNMTFALLAGQWWWWLFWWHYGGSFGWGPETLTDIQLCNKAPEGAGSNNAAALHSITQVSPQLNLPFTTPITGGTPDYTLSSVQTDAASNGGCVYAGTPGVAPGIDTVTITFNSTGGASVSGSGISASPPSCIGGDVQPASKIFFVQDADAQVSGTVNGKYTVAVASSSVTSGCMSPVETTLPGSPTFPYPVLGSCPVTIANGAGQSVGYGCTTAGVGNSYNIALTNNTTRPHGGFSNYCDSSADSIYVTGNIYYGGNSCPGTGSSASPIQSCNSELGLLSQNNVIIAYPLNGQSTVVEGSGGNDGTWVNSDTAPNPSSTSGDRPNDEAEPSGNCGGGSGDDSSCNDNNGCVNGNDCGEWWNSDEGGWWTGEPGACDGNDCGWQTNDNDAYDSDNDWATNGSTCWTTGGGGDTTDGDGNCYDTPPGAPGDSDGDEVIQNSSGSEITDSGNGITIIDADIDAVWGSFMLDNYGYWSNADHSCGLTNFYFLLTFSNEPSDDSSNCGAGGDHDGDEATLSPLTINGAVSEFWRGLLSHLVAYSGNFAVEGGYSSVQFNYDSRLLHGIPPEMQGVGPPSWQSSSTVAEASVCPTGTTRGGSEKIAPCS